MSRTPSFEWMTTSTGQEGLQCFCHLALSCGTCRLTLKCVTSTKQHLLHEVFFRFIDISFRLKNVPGTLRKETNVISAAVGFQSASVYLDNIVVLLESSVDYNGQSRRVARLLHSARVTHNKYKRTVPAQTIYYSILFIRSYRISLTQYTVPG